MIKGKIRGSGVPVWGCLKTMFRIVWQVCWPAVLYGLMVDGASALWGAETLAGTAAGAVLAVPVFAYLYGSMKGRLFDAGRGKRGAGMNAQTAIGEWIDGFFSAAMGIGLCVAVNTLIMLSPLPRYFLGFSHTAEKLYGPSVFVQAAAMGVVIPAAEELVFRGLVFGGLRRDYPFAFCAGLSAAVFGLYHGNVLQGIYGAVMGWALAWRMERKGTIKAPLLMHVAANVTSIILTALE